jgi:hypothetical protein
MGKQRDSYLSIAFCHAGTDSGQTFRSPDDHHPARRDLRASAAFPISTDGDEVVPFSTFTFRQLD